MDEIKTNENSSFGSKALDSIVQRLSSTGDPRKRYEYILWLSKKLPVMPKELQKTEIKVKGCISEVYVLGELVEGKVQWQGDSDALITRGLLALLIQGLNDLTPEEIIAIDNNFISATGLHGSLTPSRANGFLNILMNMKAQAHRLALGSSLTTK